LSSHQSYIRSFSKLNLGPRRGLLNNTSENLPLNRGSGEGSWSRIENVFVDECQILKVNFFDAFLDPEEGVVKEVGMCVTEYPRDFVCRGNMTFSAPICKKGVFRFLADMPNRGKGVLTRILGRRLKEFLGFLKKCGGLGGPDKLDRPQQRPLSIP
jgi:hypothetical protein